jgi:hypothetical protein
MSLEDRCSFLKDMYDSTLLERPVNWTLDTGSGTNLDALHKERWLRKDGTPGGTNVAAQGTAWCGIFATYCLRAIGVQAQWRLNVGIDTPPGVLEKRSGYFASGDIGPGDICVVKENQHHFIVYQRTGNMLYSYDGNLDGQMIGERTYDIEVLRAGVKKQSEYDQSAAGKAAPAQSKYSFLYYRML